MQKNCLIIQGQEIPFLNEHELPENARNGEFLDEDMTDEPKGGNALVTPGTTSVSAEGTASSSTNPAAATTTSSGSSSSPSSGL